MAALLQRSLLGATRAFGAGGTHTTLARTQLRAPAARLLVTGRGRRGVPRDSVAVHSASVSGRGGLGICMRRGVGAGASVIHGWGTALHWAGTGG